MRVAAVALLLVLAACGGGSDGKAGAPKTSAAVTTPAPVVTKATVGPPTGTPVPEVLSRFTCEPDATGAWNATGYVSNSTKKSVTYQVTVYVGAAAGASEKAKTAQVASVAAKGSAAFSITGIPVGAGDSVCHVQVLATP